MAEVEGEASIDVGAPPCSPLCGARGNVEAWRDMHVP